MRKRVKGEKVERVHTRHFPYSIWGGTFPGKTGTFAAAKKYSVGISEGGSDLCNGKDTVAALPPRDDEWRVLALYGARLE